MGTTTRLTGMTGLALAAGTLLTGTAAFAGTTGIAASAAPHAAGRHGTAGAVFVQTDNTGGNTVVAYDRSPDGTLRRAGTYPTGGQGGVEGGSVVDHLASQGSLVYDRDSRLLYAVNAGSDTITVFDVDGDRLTRRQIISSGGSFPVSVAVHRDLVYVLNARDGGSVQGYRRVGRTLRRIQSWHRTLGLDPAMTPEFTSSPGQVAFTPDGSRLLVTTKSNGNDVDVFDVDARRGPSARPVADTLPDAVPFALTFDARGHVVLAEAGPNAVATFTLNRDGTLTAIGQDATGQTATCWVVRVGTRFYVANAGSGNLSGYQDGGSGALTALGTTATDPGTVDVAADPGGQYLYAQTGAGGVVDEYRVNRDGSLRRIGSVTVPDSAGGEGIVAS